MKLLKNIFNFRNYASLTEFTPKCKDCKNNIKHIKNGKEYEYLSTCRINMYMLKNKSCAVYFNSEICRNTENYCGKKGKFFNILK